jgi:hypothetical protein
LENLKFKIKRKKQNHYLYSMNQKVAREY